MKVLVAGMLILFLVLFGRVLYIDNAAVFGDEYLYKASSDLAIDQRLLRSHGLVPDMPNLLYLKIISIHSVFGHNGYVTAGLINVLFYLLGGLPLYRIAQALGISERHIAPSVLLALALPYGLYTKLFMPESWFFTGFMFSQYFLMRGVLKQSLGEFIKCGCVIGTMFLVKPHALIALLAGLVAIVLARGSGQRSNAYVQPALLIAGFLGTVVSLRLMLSPGSVEQQTPLGFYQAGIGAAIRSFSLNLFDNPSETLRATAYVAYGHLAMIGLMYGFPIMLTINSLRNHAGSGFESARRIVGTAALTNLALLCAVSVFFTVGVNELGRIHMRYYSFVFPVFVLFLFVDATKMANHRKRLLISFVLLGFSVAGIAALRSYSPILPISTVSDGPDYGIVRLPNYALGGVYLAFLLVLFTYAANKKIFPTFAALFVALVAAVNIIENTQALKHDFNTEYTRGGEAAILSELVPETEKDKVLVIAGSLDSKAKFLFWYEGAPYQLVREEGSVVASTDIPQGVIWIATLGSSYSIGFDAQRVFANSRLVVYKVGH